MRFIFNILVLIVGFCATGTTTCLGNTIPKDSLLNLVKNTSDPKQKVMIYRNLADICFETPEECIYLKEMYKEAKKVNDLGKMRNALTDLAFACIMTNQPDSSNYYINLIKKSGKSEETIVYTSYLRMRFFEKNVYKKDGDKVLKQMTKLLGQEDIDKNNVYAKAERAYITGYGLYANEKIKESLPYFEEINKLFESFPLSDMRFQYEPFFKWQLISIYGYMADKEEEAIAQAKELLQVYKRNYESFYVKCRPFYNINIRYLQCYAFILSHVHILPAEEADHYMQLLTDMNKLIDKPLDKYNIFLGLNNYYLSRNNIEMAIATNDSLIKYAKIIAPHNLSGLYDIHAQIYEVSGDYRKAYEYYKISVQMKDSMNLAKTMEQLNELQVKYNVDKLDYENAQLEIKYRRIISLGLFLFLIVSVCISTYLYYSLKKERRMKKQLRILNARAEESEKMKTAFINSICHEIRTPLNAITGFSGLMIDESINLETKKSFYDLIVNNTNLLTSLINHMLEVANLDSSGEKLVCAPVNMNGICIHEMEKLKFMAKKDIDYLLDLPVEEVMISTNEKYLSLVIENLLSNANKFTEKGRIILGFHIDDKLKKLIIKVEDTGCGIPSEMYDVVFRRFSKLDSFTQGNGLGLYLCRLIIERLSGKIYVNAEYQQGTCFLIELPI